jgi:hypothetical protein
VFLTQSHPKQTQGSDIWCGTSMDQMYAQRFGQSTPLPSMQFCIENLDQAGGCTYNYSCAYTDAISWASPSEPLPMLRDPRAVFDTMFGAGATPEERAKRRREDRSILDTIVSSIDRLNPSIRTENARGATNASGFNPCLAAFSSIGVPCVSSAHKYTTFRPHERRKRT